MMNVDLIRFTADADGLAGLAAAECTGSGNPDSSLRHAMENGHLSVAEHACFTFRVKGVSRALLAQLTRHRIASFSVRSQRYCAVEPEWIIPPKIIEKGWEENYLSMCGNCYRMYCAMLAQDVPAEDARYVIPQGASCSLLVTMNVRELLHFFELRCCSCAQWEIRDMAWEMLKHCQKAAPKLFAKAGPACIKGPCPEGKRSCRMKWAEGYEA